jgi:hypothetical protein
MIDDCGRMVEDADVRAENAVLRRELARVEAYMRRLNPPPKFINGGVMVQPGDNIQTQIPRAVTRALD